MITYSNWRKEEYSDYAKGFYTSQLDNIAKVFASPSDTVTLSDFARGSLASMEKNKQVEYNLAQDKKNIAPNSAESLKRELAKEKTDEIEKASGEQPDDPSYKEILDTFREGLEGDSLQDEKSVQKDPDSVKTAGASSEIFSADSSEDHSEKESSEKGNSSSDGANDLSTEKEDKIELAWQRILLRVRRVLPAILQIPHQGRRQRAVLKVPSLGPLA